MSSQQRHYSDVSTGPDPGVAEFIPSLPQSIYVPIDMIQQRLSQWCPNNHQLHPTISGFCAGVRHAGVTRHWRGYLSDSKSSPQLCRFKARVHHGLQHLGYCKVQKFSDARKFWCKFWRFQGTSTARGSVKDRRQLLAAL